MNKKDAYKLKAGDLITLKWNDLPEPEVALLLAPIDRDAKGEVSLLCYYPNSRGIDSHAVHTQIVAKVGEINVLILNAVSATKTVN